MTFYPIFKLLGLNCFLLSLCFSICASIGSIQYSENFWPWIPPISIAFLLGFLAFQILPKRFSHPTILKKEVLLTISMSWLLSAILGAIPYGTVGRCIFYDALFESCSGLTSTGASVISNLDIMPKGLQLWRCFSQWLGGLGFVAFFVTFFGSQAIPNKFLYSNESTTTFTEDCAQVELRKHVLKTLIVYFILTVACVFALRLVGMTPFDAWCHSFAALGTGGFSTHAAGIPFFASPKIEWILILFMFLGGTNFLLLFRSFTSKPWGLFQSTEFRVYLGITGLSGLLIAIQLSTHKLYPFFEALRHGVFQTVSILTTTGFHSSDVNLWPNGLVPLLIGLMFIGGCSGSTSGGMKIFRVILLVKIAFLHLEKVFRRTIVRPLRLSGQAWSEKDQINLLNYFLLVVLLCVFSIGIMGFLEPNLDFKSLFSLYASCFGNVGLGLGEVGPLQGCAFLAPLMKIFLSIVMLMGRLELYAFLVLLSPSFWKSFD